MKEMGKENIRKITSSLHIKLNGLAL